MFNDSLKKNGDLNIVLDHAALQDFRVDSTKVYVDQIKKLKKKYPNKNINLCRIRKGFEYFDFEKNKWTYNLKPRCLNCVTASEVYEIFKALDSGKIG